MKTFFKWVTIPQTTKGLNRSTLDELINYYTVVVLPDRGEHNVRFPLRLDLSTCLCMPQITEVHQIVVLVLNHGMKHRHNASQLQYDSPELFYAEIRQTTVLPESGKLGDL